MREGRHVRVVGLRIVVREITLRIDARLELGGDGVRVLEVLVRGSGPLRFDASFRGETSKGAGVVASGPVEITVRVADLDPIVVSGRLLVDDARAYVDGGEVRSSFGALRFSGSIARDGTALRARGTGDLRLDGLARHAATPLRLREDDALAVSFEATGTAGAPVVVVEARASAVGLRGADLPRWMPAMRVEDLRASVDVQRTGIAATASARAGEGTVAVDVQRDRTVRVAIQSWPVRPLLGVVALGADERARAVTLASDAAIDADVTISGERARGRVAMQLGSSSFRVDALALDLASRDARGTVLSAELDVGDLLLRVAAAGLVPRTVPVSGIVHVEGRVDDASVALRVGGRAMLSPEDRRGRALAASIEGLDAELVVTRREGEVHMELTRASADGFGGRLSASGEATLGATPRGAFTFDAVRATADLFVVLAALGPASGPLVSRATASDARGRGEAWLPDHARIDAKGTVGLGGTTNAEVRVAAAPSDVRATIEVTPGERVDLHLSGRLGIGHAVDLGLFDGGALPSGEGAIELALAAAGPPDDVRVSGAFHAYALAFAPPVVLRDVHALLSVRRGVAVWNEVRAQLAGGTIALAAVVDRDGALGGMRGWLRVDALDVAQLADGRVQGTLFAELALEQDGPDTAPVIGEGSLVVVDAYAPEAVRSVPSFLPQSVVERNARARGPITARVGLDDAGVRLVDVAVPLADGHLDGAVRVGFDGRLEAHAEVHVRRLVTVPLRVRGTQPRGASDLEVDVDVDLLATALAGVAAARARVREHRHATSHAKPRPVPLHEALAAALSGTDWSAVARRARR